MNGISVYMERALPDRKFPTEIFGNFLQMENAQCLYYKAQKFWAGLKCFPFMCLWYILLIGKARGINLSFIDCSNFNIIQHFSQSNGHFRQFFFFLKIMLEIWRCGLYMSFYGTVFLKLSHSYKTKRRAVMRGTLVLNQNIC